MLNLTSTFSLFDISKHMSNEPYTAEEKQEVLERLYRIQSKLENFNDVDSEAHLTFIDNIIFSIQDLDKSLTPEFKVKLNNIINYLK